MRASPSLPPLRLAAIIAAFALASGCTTPPPKPGTVATPNFGPAAPDARTAAVIQQMELDYIAAKNSTRTNQHRADQAAAEKKKKDAEKAEAEKQAKAKTTEAPTPPPPADPEP